jgi:hypothetical protein
MAASPAHAAKFCVRPRLLRTLPILWGRSNSVRMQNPAIAAMKRADDGIPRTVAPIEEVQLYVRDASGKRVDVSFQELVNKTMGRSLPRADLQSFQTQKRFSSAAQTSRALPAPGRSENSPMRRERGKRKGQTIISLRPRTASRWSAPARLSSSRLCSVIPKSARRPLTM